MNRAAQELAVLKESLKWANQMGLEMSAKAIKGEIDYHEQKQKEAHEKIRTAS